MVKVAEHVAPEGFTRISLRQAINLGMNRKQMDHIRQHGCLRTPDDLGVIVYHSAHCYYIGSIGAAMIIGLTIPKASKAMAA